MVARGKSVPARFGAALAVGWMGLATGLSAETFVSGSVDADLRQQLDFRATDFSECSNAPACTVKGVTIRAERRNDANDGWIDARIYWDPIDGLGIIDGAQNDEIDFDERLVISFTEPRPLKRIWFSDLFLGEDPRYGSTGENLAEEVLDDVEVAGVRLRRDGLELEQLQVVGQVLLPEDSFNSGVSDAFRDDGDLRRRIVINEDIISVIAPDPTALDSSILLSSELGRIDKDKRAIFEGVETFEIDLAEILLEFHGTRLFAVGTHNFEEVRRRLADRGALEAMMLASAELRQVGDWDNGELAEQLATPTPVDTIEFFAPFDSSNDFSVAGLVFEETVADLGIGTAGEGE